MARTFGGLPLSVVGTVHNTRASGGSYISHALEAKNQ